jgi:hypothetical protein
MAQRPGGIDPLEIQAAFEALYKVTSYDDLQQIVEDLPVIRSPIFHASIRQWALRSRTKNSPLYEDLFLILHSRAHNRLCEEVGHRTSNAFPTIRPDYRPSYFDELNRILDGRIPKSNQRPLNPATDASLILADVTKAIGKPAELPVYTPSSGSHWNAVVVRCAACRRERLTYRAYAVDLLSGCMEQQLRDSKINNSVCPYCSEPLCLPLQVWVREEPGAQLDKQSTRPKRLIPKLWRLICVLWSWLLTSHHNFASPLDRPMYTRIDRRAGDLLASLSCVWKMDEHFFVYQPPPGTPRIENNDRILEVRFSSHLNRIPWPEREKSEVTTNAVVTTMSVAYTIEELQHHLSRVDDDIPLAMSTMVDDIGRKLRSGILPFYEAQSHVLECVPHIGRDWPLASPTFDPGDLHRNLVLSLIQEAVAEAKGSPMGLRAVFAAATCSAFLALGEHGMAQSCLARAEDIYAKAATDDPLYEGFGWVLANTRMELNLQLGRHREAEAERRSVVSSQLLTGETLVVRLTRQQLASSEALAAFDRLAFGQALELYPRCIANLERLEREASESTDSKVRGQLSEVQHTLSGDLANFAVVLIELSKYWKIYDILLSGLPTGEVETLLTKRGIDPRCAATCLEEATPELERMFPTLLSREALMNEALCLLGRALTLSELTEGWEFAGVQSHRLMLLLEELGRLPEAEIAAGKAITFGARAGDHRRIWTAHCFLAECAMGRRAGGTALEHLAESARDLMREAVGLGYDAKIGGEGLSIAAACLQSVQLGADPVTAVLIAESLKAVTTASSIAYGTPMQPLNEGQRNTEQLGHFLQLRESLRLKAVWAPDDKAVLDTLKTVQVHINEQRKSIGLRDPRYARWVDATYLELSERQGVLRRLQLLGPETTLLGLLPVQETIWAYMFWHEGCLISRKPLPLVDPAAMLRQLTVDETVLADLSRSILQPFDERLQQLTSCDRLIISTYDTLCAIPFAALPYRDSPLCNHVCLSVIQGIGIFEACLGRPDVDFNSILVVGAPDRPDLTALPGALLEVTDIEAAFRAAGRLTQLLTRAEATVPAFRTAVARHDIVHLACHALMPQSRGDSSRLMLAVDLQAKDSGELSEERVLSELLMKPGCLVNLAGCTTGFQIEADSPLLAGLIPAFLVAGAASVLGNIWPINDATSVRFHNEFYRLLLAGHRPAGSLAEAQRACIQGKLGLQMRNTAEWAGYIVYGVG